ncbi:MAG: carboxypeptidase M32 [Pseudomonadota bacterium]
MSNSAYDQLLDHQKQTEALSQINRLLHWDKDVMMPAAGTDQRGEQSGALQAVLHARATDPRVGDWLAAIDADALDPVGRANVRLAAQSRDRAMKVPADLAVAQSRLTARATTVWAEARSNSDFKSFAPVLEEVINLTRQEAECLATDDRSPYDALLNDFELGATEAGIAETFDRLRVGLVDLRARIMESGVAVTEPAGTFPADAQMDIARQMATGLRYDWAAGRLDLTVHPFCSGTRGDARITTRVDEADPFNCIYSTIHETGHGLYEQGLDPDLEWQPAGSSVSMGVHESQSRLCENQIGRSAAYAEWLFPKMQEKFGDFGLPDPDALYRAVNRVRPGFIRTEADEVHYNLHIMMRFDLERALIRGDLTVSDLEAAWNDRFLTDFGQPVTDAANGVLQDVHWSAGLFGYFPTYTLGNLYAAELWSKIREELGDVDAMIRNGDVGPIIDWLRRTIHRRGSILTPLELITEAIGHAPTEQALLDYLNGKFGALYGV